LRFLPQDILEIRERLSDLIQKISFLNQLLFVTETTQTGIIQ